MERYLSASETLSDILHLYGADTVLHCAMIRSKQAITQEILEHAFSVLLQFQPTLYMYITSEQLDRSNACKRFVCTDIQKDIQVLQARNRKSWVDLAEVELSRPFNSSRGPLWKLKYVEFTENIEEDNMEPESSRTEQGHEGAFLFTIHKVIADAVCLFDLLYRQLIAILNSILEGGSLTQFHNPLLLLPSVEDAFTDEKHKSVTKVCLPTQLNPVSGKHQSLFRPLLTCISGNSQPVVVSTSKLLPFIMSPATTRELIERCYAKYISPKAALITAAAMSLGITASANDIRLGNEITICLPVDLRQFANLPRPQPLGNWQSYDYCTVHKRSNHVEPKQFWDQAFRVHQDLLRKKDDWIKRISTKNYINTERNILKKISKEHTVAPLSSLHKAHFTMHDLGNCDLMTAEPMFSEYSPHPPQDGYRPNGAARDSIRSRDSQNSDLTEAPVIMSEHFFTSAMSDVSTIPLHLTVCTYRGKFMWTLTYNGSWITKAFATKFIDRLLATLDQLVREL